MTVFESFNGYGFVHHRALNDFSALGDAMQLISDHRERTHILEGDICWDFAKGNNAFYFRHPSFVVDTLSASKIAQGHADKKLLNLSDLLPLKSTNAFLVIELKVGRGDWKAAIESLVATLEEHFTGRYWIDGFSLPMLEYVKQINPGTTVTLHTEFVSKGRVLIAAPEWPTVRIRKLANLHAIDGIAIRRRGSEKFMTRACADVRNNGKALLLSRLHNLREFECSKLWGAKAGYMHWDFGELLKFNDEIDARRELSGSSNA